MVRVTLDSIIPGTVPADGWVVRYRIKGSGGAYTTLPPFTSLPIIFTTTDPAGTLYEGFIKRDCGSLESLEFAWVTSCRCASTYIPSASGTYCQKTETISPTITNSGYCLTASKNPVYSSYETRVYQLGFTNSDLALVPGTPVGGNIAAVLTSSPQWRNATLDINLGPMNRDGVWIDSDCDGTRDPLSVSIDTTIAYMYSNTGAAKVIYIGIGADNEFELSVNGVIVAQSDFATGVERPFRIWHIVPVNILAGINYFNAVAKGDGSVDDSIAMVIYDNTLSEISAAVDDSQLNILFRTSSLRGSSFDVSTCPSGYSLDVSAGVGNYACRRVLTKVCNSVDS